MDLSNLATLLGKIFETILRIWKEFLKDKNTGGKM